jgi:DNA polymerase-3 subunit gamma/tau
MPYTVFALKWRPRKFDEIVGQNHIVTTLKNAISANRLAHAYLFAGPRGVGKTSTARILAKALNCKNGPTQEPCGRCVSCLEISENRSLDVIEIDGASNRGIDEIRVLRENVKFSPLNGKFKIYIIDEVHQITADGFNALLKTLEEPPSYVKFIFATTHPHKVIPTILSRCQRFDFRRIPAMEITTQLERIVASEKINIDKEVLFAIAKSSDGSLRDAESVLEQLITFSRHKISLKDAIAVLGLIEDEVLFQITEKIITKDARGVLDLLGVIIDEGKDVGVFLNSLIEHFRNLMIAKVAKADTKLIDLPQDSCERLLKQSDTLSLEDIFGAFNILVATQDMSKRLDSLRIPLEIALVRLAHDKRGSVVSSPSVRQTDNPIQHKSPGQALEEKAPKENEAGGKRQESAQKPLGITLEGIKGEWQKIIDNIAKVKMSTATYLNEGKIVDLQGNTLVISFLKNYSLHREALDNRDNRELIEKIISGLLDVNLKVKFILSAEEEGKEEAQDNAFLKSALDVFNGRVIKEEL